MDLTNVDLLSLQTRAMQQDVTVRGFTAALAPSFVEIASQVINGSIYARIEDLPERALDVLAWQFNVVWYDPDSDLETKRRTIHDALLVKQTLGTPAAVQRVVETYFGDGRVEEWFEYGGAPYHFRIVTSNPSATGEQAELLVKTVNSVKNIRSRLDSVIIESTESMNLYVGMALHLTDNLTLKQVV